MSGTSLQYVLLVVCWMAALVSLVIFLESWLALTRQSRLAPRKATATHGVVSVLVPLGGGTETIRRALQSILDQSYPFIELLLIHNAKDAAAVSLVQEFVRIQSHVPVQSVPLDFPISGETSRVRALDQAQSRVRGSWILVLDPGIALDECAIESALEFAQTEDLTAVALSTGIECRSLVQKLLAPSLEWFVRMIQIVDRGRDNSHRPHPTDPFMLLHGHTQTVINKMNKLPGILNESGWTLWSYRVEGLRTFQGDGSGWIAREGTIRSLTSGLDKNTLGAGRVAAFVLGSALISVVSVVGILIGFSADAAGFAELGILYFSAFSYSLMGASYFFYSRQLGAATWFAPLWFLAHSAALMAILAEFNRSEPVELQPEIETRQTGPVPTSRNR